MQTFLCYPDFAESARVLDNKRLGKQRVECLQILKTLAKGPHICRVCGKSPIIQEMDYCPYCKVYKVIKVTPWYNHPAVKMWKGWECTLTEYSLTICREWQKRGFKDSVHDKIRTLHWGNNTERHVVSERQQGHTEFYTPFIGNEAFHASHRSNLLRKDPTYYSQFGWKEPNNLPYVWPVK